MIRRYRCKEDNVNSFIFPGEEIERKGVNRGKERERWMGSWARRRNRHGGGVRGTLFSVTGWVGWRCQTNHRHHCLMCDEQSVRNIIIKSLHYIKLLTLNNKLIINFYVRDYIFIVIDKNL